MRTNGDVQDLRLPLPDGAADPDPDDAGPARPRRALRPAPLGRAPARGGRAPALSRARRSRSARRSRTASTTTSSSPSRSARTRSSGSRRRSGARSRRAAIWERWEVDRDEARGSSRPRTSRTRSSWSTRPTGTISLYRQGDFTDLCRGPHLQNARADQGRQADLPRRRVLARRLVEAAADARLRHRVLRPEGPREHLHRLEEAKRRDHRRLGTRARPRSSSPSSRPGMPFWHPQRDGRSGTCSRTCAGARTRGAATGRSHAAALRLGSLAHLGPLGQVPRGHVHARDRGPRLRAEADELPGPLPPLLADDPQLPRSSAPARRGREPAPQRALGRPPRAPARPALRRRTTRTSSARTSRSHDELARLPRLRVLPLRPASASTSASSSRPGPRTGSAPTRSGTWPRRRSRGARRARARLRRERRARARSTGPRSTCT